VSCRVGAEKQVRSDRRGPSARPDSADAPMPVRTISGREVRSVWLRTRLASSARRGPRDASSHLVLRAGGQTIIAIVPRVGSQQQFRFWLASAPAPELGRNRTVIRQPAFWPFTGLRVWCPTFLVYGLESGHTRSRIGSTRISKNQSPENRVRRSISSS
jgi:hypothetical protein